MYDTQTNVRWNPSSINFINFFDAPVYIHRMCFDIPPVSPSRSICSVPSNSSVQSICAVKTIWKIYKLKKLPVLFRHWLIQMLNIILIVWYILCNSPPHIISHFRKFGYQGWLIRIAFTSAGLLFQIFAKLFIYLNHKFLINEPNIQTPTPQPPPPPPINFSISLLCLWDITGFPFNFPNARSWIDMTRLRDFNWNVLQNLHVTWIYRFCWYNIDVRHVSNGRMGTFIHNYVGVL